VDKILKSLADLNLRQDKLGYEVETLHKDFCLEFKKVNKVLEVDYKKVGVELVKLRKVPVRLNSNKML